MKLPGIITLLAAAFIAFLLMGQHNNIKTVKHLKQEKAQVLNIRHGLLSLDEWKEKSYQALSSKIENFRLDVNDQRALKPQIQTLLHQLLDQVEAVAEAKKNEGGVIQRFIAAIIQDMILDFDSLRNRIPEFTDNILSELGNQTNQRQIKDMILRKLEELLDLNAPRIDQEVRDHFFSTYDCNSFDDCGQVLNERIAPLEHAISANRPLMLVICAVCGLLLFISGKSGANRFNIFALAVLCSVLLFGGITYPMISIDARILDFEFSMLGMSVEFGEQILFYQSKSILEIVRLLITDGKIDTIIVGILILVFSIVFPLVKILLSLTVSKDKPGAIAKYLTTKASKWSMADVFVVAIFMGFIGLRGVIGSQIDQIKDDNPFVDLIATDYTSLNIGFTLFLLFCLCSLLLGKMTSDYLAESTMD